MEDLSGKWLYREEYERGKSTGEMTLRQEGARLSGKIIFMDRADNGESFMMQEQLSGTLDGKKVRLEATEADVIHAERAIEYKLDHWFGLLVDENTIIGLSKDEQEIEGYFTFSRG
ncbi:MAG: hypothetical protein LBG30_02825 [Odoribacteraceae bacterium]|jgi:hypothetical protein|nr:hypothetical protein [Odoribacteraceae bacterium]